MFTDINNVCVIWCCRFAFIHGRKLLTINIEIRTTPMVIANLETDKELIIFF